MDWTDEIETGIYHDSYTCSWSPSFYCHEHLCRRHYWTCGDGQCLPQGTNRFRAIWNQNIPLTCLNLRDINFICEVNRRHRLWTIQSGFCLPFEQISYDDRPNELINDIQYCTFLLKCLLSVDINIDCPCSNLSRDCIKKFEFECRKFHYVEYPSGPLINPFMWTVYDVYKSFRFDGVPDYFYFNGSIKCRDYQSTWMGMEHRRLEYDDYVFLAGMISFPNLFCSAKTDIVSNTSFIKRDYSSNARKMHPYCWNDTRTFDNRLYQTSPDICQDTECISSYRLKDGSPDCELWADEWNYVRSSCESNRQYRFQCLEDQETCLLASETYNLRSNCSNTIQYGLSIRTLNCQKRHDLDCQILKHFIAISSTKNQSLLSNLPQNDVMLGFSKVPVFHQYCDTFFDLSIDMDESRELCQNWICAKEQYQCATGQCIPTEWICDGEYFTKRN
ncbi:unnamed protein product [Rotaria sp. Silwood2]|nr:unnamed protein product [Rotaria sp. Silwood2]CAF2873977.1 unnamed protein product [Rotaria sp. Silwood2]CAF3108307.1 unnamed protein product [Rotaria sp. Silwood2]CAF3250238.1 unnamed protein product [Rotaria sp. Silwood2]CAF4321911.1 unnamed protein product [Rotaria sp. Silwood2]